VVLAARDEQQRSAAASTVRQGCRLSFSSFIVPISDSHIALSNASPTVPMLATIPSPASRRVNANDVYWLP
jgi:hypothetical protein